MYRNAFQGFAGCILIFFLLLFVLYGVLWAAGGFLIVADPLKATDAVVVLSGGGPERIQEASRLMRDGYAHALILTDTGEVLPNGVTAIELLRQEALKLGVPADKIHFTRMVVQNTIDEAEAVVQLEEQLGFNHCTVVTDPFHSRRTRLVFRQALSGHGIQVRIQPVRGHWYKSNTWFFSSRGWSVTLSEYGKLFLWLLP